ncbi:unnamed protein product [Blepharisma stoltei]|uniref:Uncharacterized protein n=1 Tax=Blepharisma stoltei TaxID=1481888 RepID=A0AAU9IA48_9CILI|nr:unnamed protein product [Blepharisma stoltei]
MSEKPRRILPWQAEGLKKNRNWTERKKNRKIHGLVKIRVKISSLGAKIADYNDKVGENIILHHPLTTSDFCMNAHPSKILEPPPRKIRRLNENINI